MIACVRVLIIISEGPNSEPFAEFSKDTYIRLTY